MLARTRKSDLRMREKIRSCTCRGVRLPSLSSNAKLWPGLPSRYKNARTGRSEGHRRLDALTGAAGLTVVNRAIAFSTSLA